MTTIEMMEMIKEIELKITTDNTLSSIQVLELTAVIITLQKSIISKLAA